MTLSDMWHCGRTKQYRPRNNCRPPTWHSKVKVKLEEESGAKRGREGGGGRMCFCSEDDIRIKNEFYYLHYRF